MIICVMIPIFHLVDIERLHRALRWQIPYVAARN
jgi:hypothetical protein